jgi:hypothetical protein
MSRTFTENDSATAIAFLRDRATAAEARVRELEAGLRECADELEWEIRARYGEPVHPAEQRKFERDMAIVVRARALLEDGK